MNINVIPKPYFIEEKANNFSFKKALNVKGCKDSKSLNNLIKFLNSLDIKTDEKESKIIELIIDKKIISTEEYLLDVDENTIKISASTDLGLYYGVQTLKQLIFDNKVNDEVIIPCIKINDKPLYSYRGYMLDIVRHFFGKEDIKRLIDLISLLKFNVFHLHLTDDQGWRIEISKYTNLISVGSKRSETLGDKKPHGGYLTKADIKEIIDYANENYITIIPEIDMPGHFTAAIASYPYLGCSGKNIPVATSFGIKSDIACAGKDSTYQFIYDVLDEVIELFPSPYIHIGGDEAPKQAWMDCPDCKNIKEKEKLPDYEALQAYFTNKIVDYIQSKGKKVIVWNESINSGILNDNVICQYWADGKEPIRVVNEINKGRDTIISKFTPLYLDYPFAMHSLKAVYEFNPIPEGVKYKDKIIGIESPLWAEYVKDNRKIDYMTFPRLCAVSELNWNEKKDYEEFKSRIKSFDKLLDFYGVKYAPLKETDPTGLRKIKQMLKFAKNLMNKESIKSLRQSMKNKKQVDEGRNV